MPSMADSAVKSTLDEIESILLTGNRVGASKLAASAELWSHALIISGRADQECFRDVVLAFTRSEFNTQGGNAKSMASSMAKTEKYSLRILYGLFAEMGPVVG